MRISHELPRKEGVFSLPFSLYLGGVARPLPLKITHNSKKKTNNKQTNKQTRKLLEPGSLPTIHVIHEADMKYVES